MAGKGGAAPARKGSRFEARVVAHTSVGTGRAAPRFVTGGDVITVASAPSNRRTAARVRPQYWVGG